MRVRVWSVEIQLEPRPQQLLGGRSCELLTWFMTCVVKSRNMDLTHSSPSIVADRTLDMNTASNLLASFLSSELSSGAKVDGGGGAADFLLRRSSSFAFSSGVKHWPLPSGRFNTHSMSHHMVLPSNTGFCRGQDDVCVGCRSGPGPRGG